MTMSGSNAWDSRYNNSQPSFLRDYGNLTEFYFGFVCGCLRWARILRGSTFYTGWALCYQDGTPITYADANQPGSIRVSASGSYMTL